MSIGDTAATGADLHEVPPSEASEVRHFDQLDHREQHAFLRLYRGEEPSVVPLVDGEVVVFTGYFRVEC